MISTPVWLVLAVIVTVSISSLSIMFFIEKMTDKELNDAGIQLGHGPWEDDHEVTR